jgi:uncharacterized protein involved in exopolysaccharide biosynthesis
LIDQIAQYQTDLQEIKTQIASDTAALQVLENISQSTDIVKSEDFNLSIDTSNDAKKSDETAETPNVIVPPDSLQDSLLTIKINTIQTQLITNIAKKDTLGNRIPDLESTLTDSQITLTEQGYKYDTVLKDMEIAKQTYQAYQQRSREVLTYSSSDIGKSIVWLSSEAQIPKEPDSPKKIKNIAIAGMLGFSLSMFFVLFQNYLKRTKVVPSK